MSQTKPLSSSTLRLYVALLGAAAWVGCAGDAQDEPLGDEQAAAARDRLPQTLASPDAGSSIDAAIPTTPAGDAATLPSSPAPGDACDELTYTSFGRKFFSDYCATCHRLPNPTFNDLDEVTNFRRRIEFRVLQSPATPMPPLAAAKRPTEGDKQKLAQWLKCEPFD